MQSIRQSVHGPGALPGLLARYRIEGSGKLDYPEFTEAVDRLVDATKASHHDLNARLDAIEARLNRPGFAHGAVAAGKNHRNSPEMRDWERFLRRGENAVERQNSLVIGDDTSGGFLAPDGFEADLARNVVLFSPVRQLARVSQISVPAVQLPRRTGTLTGSWVGETEPRSATGPTYGSDRFDAKEAGCYVDIGNAMLEDAAFDILAELSLDFAEEFGRLEGSAFLVGASPKQPEGILTNSGLVSVNSGNATLITPDSLIDAFHKLPAPYRANGTWLMNATTLGSVRKMKDGDGQYLLSMSGINNAPATTILGRPVYEAPDMPNEGAGATPVLFGDFMQGYRIFDRLQLSVIRDPLTQATSGLTRFHARRRVAGGVRKAEALVKLVCST